jgi:hypothetical protein
MSGVVLNYTPSIIVGLPDFVAPLALGTVKERDVILVPPVIFITSQIVRCKEAGGFQNTERLGFHSTCRTKK